MKKILKRLDLEKTNAGTWLGRTQLEDRSAPLIESFNPANGELIAIVRSTSDAEYGRLVTHARESFRAWRKIPAPARGEAVWLVGDALRDNKDALGSLVTLEMGKIKFEGTRSVSSRSPVPVRSARPGNAVRQPAASSVTNRDSRS